MFTICDDILNKIAENDTFLTDNDNETNDSFSYNQSDILEIKQTSSENLFKLDGLNIVENKRSPLNDGIIKFFL